MNSSPTFDQMQTSTIQLWLHEAQWCLPATNGDVRKALEDGIRAAATELLHRYRVMKQNSI